MSRSIPAKRSPLALAILLAATGAPVIAQESGIVEEIVVTGSYIKGSPTDAPSPVQSIDRSSIEASGAAVITDVIKNMEVNSGSIDNPGTGAPSQTAGTASINLRNLGENSTLTLINGRRQVSAAANTASGGEFVDINAIPTIMTDRIEVLTDGGSALYGSDAVAGVVNIIMRTDFEGFELYGEGQKVQEASGAYDTTLSGIWGWASDDGNTHFVLSAERYDQDPVTVRDANFFDQAEFVGSVGSSPWGDMLYSGVIPFGSPAINPAYVNQELTLQNDLEDDGIVNGSASTAFTDPLCDDLGFFVGSRSETRGERSGECLEDTAEWNYIAYGQERNSVAGSFSHMFGRSELYSFFMWSDSETERGDDGEVEARGPTVALADPSANFFGMALGAFAPYAGLTPPTSADMPNNPNSLANGGINAPYWTQPRVGFPRVGGDDNVTRTSTATLQLGLRGDFDLSGKTYDYDVGYSWSGTSLEQDYRTFQRDRIELAINGLGGPDCTPNGIEDFDFMTYGGPLWSQYYGAPFTQTFFPGFVFTTRESISLALTSNNHGQNGCQFYNPYLTSVANPDLANSQEMMEWMAPVVRRTDKRNKLGVFDAVVSGEMFELAGGTAQFAVGAQYRMQTNASIANRLNEPGIPNAILGYDASGVPNEFHYVSNNFECSQCSFNYDHDRNVKAAFAEFSLPFMDKIETQLALRWEDYGGTIGSEVTSKFALSYRPIESLLFRTSYSQSFRAPNVPVVYEGLEAGAATFQDPLRNQAVRAGLLEPTNANAQSNFTYTVGAPSPDVGNEYADTYNIGAIWTPAGALEGLTVQADFWRFDVEDRVLPQPVVSGIEHEIEAFQAAAQDPGNYVRNDYLDGTDAAGAPVNPYTSCDPNALEAQYGRDSEERLNCVVNPQAYVVEGVVRAAQNTRAGLTTVYLGSINAGTINADGVDFKTSYDWDNDWGLFNVGLSFTHIRRFELNDVPGLELGLMQTGVFDAAGTTGDGNLARSMPDNKGTLTFNWLYENHGINLTGRYIGGYTDLSYDNLYARSNDTVRSLLSREIDDYNTWNMQYSYRHNWNNESLGTTTFTFGVVDMFNADIPYRETGGLNYDATVFDGTGRRIYGRVLLQF
ncbi:TonB-dependent receptor [Proteobacteria bacterium 005FR1]|nr:TonB-dependent receptor [Proteobacteria bacterium 005FR1]